MSTDTPNKPFKIRRSTEAAEWSVRIAELTTLLDALRARRPITLTIEGQPGVTIVFSDAGIVTDAIERYVADVTHALEQDLRAFEHPEISHAD